jgi:peroxiredoxin
MLGAPAALNMRPMARTATAKQGPPLRGAKAPRFKLRSTPDQFVELADLRGRPVLLVFYPADWSPVCSDQLVVYQEIMPVFAKYEAQVLGISVDGAWCHAAFAKHRNLRFPLLADFEPKGEVARAYGVYRAGDGVSERALILVDRLGKVFWSYVSPIGVNPGADGALRALQGMAESAAANTAAA